MISRFLLFWILLLGYSFNISSQIASSKDSTNQKYVFEENSGDFKDLGDSVVTIENRPLFCLEKMPEFPGGNDSIDVFISNNIIYSNLNPAINIEGRVSLRIIITSTGSIEDIKIVRGLEPTYDKEAIRVISIMPNWIPGRQNGINKPVYYPLTINFKKWLNN